MVRFLVIVAAALLASGPAFAQAPDTVFLEDLTWTELKDQIAAGKTTALIPVGGVEQSGPDMALGKHDVRVRALSERIARKLGNVLVAPVVAFVPEGAIDPPTSHMRFPGTITLPSDVFRKTLESVASSLKSAGFRDVVLIGDHGGYQSDLAAVADRLNKSWSATPVRAHFVAEYYRTAQTGYVAALRSHGLSDAEIGTHAGVADTSLMLAVDPRLVRAEKLPGGAQLDAQHGVYGDPRRSSAALGGLGTEAIVDVACRAIAAAVSRR